MQANEEGSSESAGMGDAFDATAGHLTGPQAAWMAHWLRLVELEEAGLPDKRSEIWALPGAGPQTPPTPPSPIVW